MWSCATTRKSHMHQPRLLCCCDQVHRQTKLATLCRLSSGTLGKSLTIQHFCEDKAYLLNWQMRQLLQPSLHNRYWASFALRQSICCHQLLSDSSYASTAINSYAWPRFLCQIANTFSPCMSYKSCKQIVLQGICGLTMSCVQNSQSQRRCSY